MLLALLSRLKTASDSTFHAVFLKFLLKFPQIACYLSRFQQLVSILSSDSMLSPVFQKLVSIFHVDSNNAKLALLS